MQEHKYIEKLERLRENAAMLSIGNQENHKLADQLHNLCEKLMSKVADSQDYNKLKLNDTVELLKKRGISKVKNEKLKEIIEDILDVLDNDDKGFKLVNVIFKNNGKHINIDK
ncbi:MAG: hypothetical protein RL208_620, partial [Pseudomonadota bacterium]